jgi:hypothetical protein
MTQQYLAGELSRLLGRLAATAPDPVAEADVARLRRAAETTSIGELGTVVVRALHLTNTLCWTSVDRGDLAAFDQQAELGAELSEFGHCSRLLTDPDGR